MNIFNKQTFSSQSNFSESQTDSTFAANVLYKYVDGKTIFSLQPEDFCNKYLLLTLILSPPRKSKDTLIKPHQNQKQFLGGPTNPLCKDKRHSRKVVLTSLSVYRCPGDPHAHISYRSEFASPFFFLNQHDLQHSYRRFALNLSVPQSVS